MRFPLPLVSWNDGAPSNGTAVSAPTHPESGRTPTTPGIPMGGPTGSESTAATTYPPSTTTRIVATTATVAHPPRVGRRPPEVSGRAGGARTGCAPTSGHREERREPRQAAWVRQHPADSHAPGHDVAEHGTTARVEHVGEAEAERRRREREQLLGVGRDRELRAGIGAVPDLDLPRPRPNRDRHTGVGNGDRRRGRPQESQAGRVAFEVLVDQPADHARQAARLLAAVDDRHGSNTTFVACRRSNNA